MTGQIPFFEISHIDFIQPNIAATVTDLVATDSGQSIIGNVRNRNLTSSWLTTGSTDAGLTEQVWDFRDTFQVTYASFIEANWKDYTIDYWSGVAWVNLFTVTNNTETTVNHTFDVDTTKMRITIQKTMVVDDEKRAKQIIFTRLLGQFEDWPIISDTEHSLQKTITELLSGKVAVTESSGGYSSTLRVNGWTNQNDIDLLEQIFFARKGVLMYINSGVADNFRFRMLGYQKQDYYVVRPVNEFSNDLIGGRYNDRPDIEINLREVSR